jgi:hypothetical protein
VLLFKMAHPQAAGVVPEQAMRQREKTLNMDIRGLEETAAVLDMAHLGPEDTQAQQRLDTKAETVEQPLVTVQVVVVVEADGRPELVVATKAPEPPETDHQESSIWNSSTRIALFS